MMSETKMPERAQVLVDFQPSRKFFVGIDSDGCAMDAMDIKHQECFTPSYIKYFDLQAASTLVRETALFVNLYSTTRGQNRWVALARLFELLKQRPEVLERGVKVPEGKALQGFLDSGYPRSDRGIADYAAAHPSAEIEQCMEWGKGVNELLKEFRYTGCKVSRLAIDFTVGGREARATFSIVGASMIEVSEVASWSSTASCSRAIVVCVTESEPAVRMATTRSPGSSKTNILR